MNQDNEKSDDVSLESDSFSLLLNKPEAKALKTRHCMKEDCLICNALINVGESQSSVMLPVQAKDCREIDKDSNISLGICRICHCNPETLPELGQLESVCNCRGTVALVHMRCLERWLAESDTSSCELCRFQFTVQRIPKRGPVESFLAWANEVADFNQVQKDLLRFLITLPLILILVLVALKTLIQLVTHCIFNISSPSRVCAGINHFILCLAKITYYNLKFKAYDSPYGFGRTVNCHIWTVMGAEKFTLEQSNLLMDTVWFWLMTPLAAMAGYIFIRATSELLDENFPTDAPWLMAALLLNSSLTMVAYYGWVMNSVKRHISSWYRWWRTMDCIIKFLVGTKGRLPLMASLQSHGICFGSAICSLMFYKNDSKVWTINFPQDARIRKGSHCNKKLFKQKKSGAMFR